MKYFVTGATGFLGGRVVRQLRAAGHEVTALVRNPEKAAALVADGVKLAPGDVTDAESLRAPMKGMDGVFHIAGWYKLGVRDRRAADAVNVEGTRNVLTMMRALGISKGIYTSSLVVNSDTHGKTVDETYHFEGRHLSDYDRTKAAAHHLAARFARDGLPLVIVQPGVFYGPGGDIGPIHDFFVQFLRRQIPVKPRVTAFCWAHVDDVARGHLLALERGRAGETYMLAGPAYELGQVLALCEKITGVRGPRLTAPAWLMKAMAATMGVIERVVPVPASYSGEYLRESAGTTYLASSAKARRELGWEARTLEEGLPETLRYEMAALGMQPPAAVA